jgi:signal transduction histidine kinase
MDILNNLDLFSVGMTIAGIGILGFVVYFNNTKSITNKTFLLFALITIIWSIANYSYYQVESLTLAFWLIRFVIFLGVWHAFTFFQLARVFPKEKFSFSDNYKWILIPIVAITSFINLTPLVFKRAVEVSESGGIAEIENGPAIALFGIIITAFIISGIVILIRKTIQATGVEKSQFRLISLGTFLTFVLIITFNFILPSFFNNSKFISLSAVFIFPFVLFTSYAILRYKLFNIKIITTATMAFVLSVVTFLEIVFSEGFEQVMFRSGVFVLVLVFSIFLLKSVKKEVTQREQIEKLAGTLEKANVRLKELDKMKSEFVSFATHQIRAPITAIKGYTSLIMEGSYGEVSEDMKEAVDRIYKSSQSLSIVVDDYLNISRIEMGRMKYNFAILDFGKLIREVAEELTPNIMGAKLELNIDIDDSKEYKAKIDEGKMRQVITNLIDNAVKYTKEGSINISISKDESKKKLLAKISDTGIGIKKATIPKLFNKFSRAKDANETNIHGTGLGLYIAKQMAEAHKGGRVWAESEGEGKGSQFYVEVDAVNKKNKTIQNSVK